MSMGMGWTVDAVLGSVSPALLRAYLTRWHVAMPDDRDGDTAGEAREITTWLTTLAPELAVQLYRDCNGVATLASPAGYRQLIAMGLHPEQSDPVDVVACTAAYHTLTDRVFWILLYQRTLFEEAVARVKVGAMRTGWHDRQLQPLPLPPTIADATCTLVAEGVRAYYAREGRGQTCVVRAYHHGAYTYCCASVTDYACVEMVHAAPGQPSHRLYYPTFDVVWRFQYRTGRLSLSMPDAGKPQIDALTDIFIAAIMPEYQGGRVHQLYTPDVLVAQSERALLATARELYPEVQAVAITELRYDLPGCDAVLTVSMRHGASRHRPISVRQVVDRALNHADPWVMTSRLIGASVQVTFPGDGNHGCVTARIKVPDYCDLDDQPLHQQVQQVLAYVGVDDGTVATAGPDAAALAG